MRIVYEDGPITRVANIRFDEYDEYVGRAGKGQNGTFGNPYRAWPGASESQVLSQYENYFQLRIGGDDDFRLAVSRLKGKRLGCFCRPREGFKGRLLCHAQYIAAWLDGIRPEEVE